MEEFLSHARVTTLVARVRGHREAGEGEVRIGVDTLAALVAEVWARREHSCPTLQQLKDADNRVWGYDG
jgi:hypothetical protein